MFKAIFKAIVAIIGVTLALVLMAAVLYKVLLPPEELVAAENPGGAVAGSGGTIESGGSAEGSEIIVGSGSAEGNEIIVGSESAEGSEAIEGGEDVQTYVREGTNPLVFIDAGHGGEDSGCVGGGVDEKDINLSVAKLVEGKLAKAGFDVLMSRGEDAYVTKDDRVKMANSAQADIFVSIHQNFSDDEGVSGMEVWYDGESGGRGSRRLALLVSQQMSGSTLAFEREVRGDTEFYVTKNSNMPACLVEAGFLSNEQEREKLVSGEYQDKLAAGIVQGITYYFYPKPLYLTFDDGPSEKITPRVLDILKERDIKATFFIVGKCAARYPELVRRIAEEGHTIGLHSYSHDYGQVYGSVEAFVADFERARKAVYDASGVDARIFRFPGGSISKFNRDTRADIIKEMTDRGYRYFDWNASLEDAAVGVTTEQILANGLRTARKQGNPLMLAHDSVPGTGAVLEELLDSLPEYEVRPITDDVAAVHF